jgi:hypothetical protein
MARPNGQRIAEEIRSSVGVLSKKPGQGQVSLGPVAHPARGHKIAARSIAALHAWLHVIRRQLIDIIDLATVDAAISIALKNLFTPQGKLPLDAAVCNPRTFTFAPCVRRD